DRGLHGSVNARLDALGLVELLRHADPQTLQVGTVRQLDGLRQLDGRRVALVAPGDERVEVGAVADRLRDRTVLVEARGKGDDPVARDGAVGRPEADVAAERRRLLDRAARVGAERPWREAAADGRGRSAPRTAWNPRGIPRVMRRPERGVLGRRAHRELVGVGLAEAAKAVRLPPL